MGSESLGLAPAVMLRCLAASARATRRPVTGPAGSATPDSSAAGQSQWRRVGDASRRCGRGAGDAPPAGAPGRLEGAAAHTGAHLVRQPRPGAVPRRNAAGQDSVPGGHPARPRRRHHCTVSTQTDRPLYCLQSVGSLSTTVNFITNKDGLTAFCLFFC